MRFKSNVVDGFQVFAVVGTHTASFGIDATNADITDLLGFAIERVDKKTGKRKFVENFKVFHSLVPNPKPDDEFSSEQHPIQSFVWDAFTLYPAREYEFVFHPFRGKPGVGNNLASTPISLPIKTESTFDANEEHDIFFNRGVASSQAYATKFENKAPDKQATPAKCKEAFDWLQRGLFTAMKRFIDSAQAGETIHGCFYEFHHPPIVQALADAANRGVNVLLVIDGKQNEHTDKDGTFHAANPREANLKAIADAQLPSICYRLREARKNDLQHNKFMVLHRNGKPVEVWTGSTNVSLNGIFGQTNVGHWVRNANVAQQFEQYFQVLLQDPGGKDGSTPHQVHADNDAYYKAVDALAPLPATFDAIPQGVTAVFSPRSTLDPLKRYAEGVGDAKALACITLAFGIGQEIKDALLANDKNSAPSFLLLERKDAKNPHSNKPFHSLNTENNVYEAWGAFLSDPISKWTRETNLFKVGVATNVAYIHTKFLLHDPLSKDPIVITGSANFSEASVHIGNDENMLWIRGSLRAADIYFTEFNRLFYHYFFRSVVERLDDGAHNAGNSESRFLDETTQWLAKYEPGTLRYKRVGEFRSMHFPVVGP